MIHFVIVFLLLLLLFHVLSCIFWGEVRHLYRVLTSHATTEKTSKHLKATSVIFLNTFKAHVAISLKMAERSLGLKD